jgi:fused signal recognition particle receptor
VSELEPKKPGLLGRLFGRKGEAAPTPEAGSPSDTLVHGTPPGEAPADFIRDEHAPVVDTPDVDSLDAPTDTSPAAPLEKKSWLSRLTTGLARTSSKLSEGITGIFTKRKLDANTLDDLEDLLIQADLGLETTKRITDAIGKGRFEKGISPDEVRQILADEVARVLRPVAKPLIIDPTHKPHVVLVVGVNGSGKTTTIGKLGAQYAREGRSVIMAAGDTFRAAAIDQLKVWGERTNTPVISRPVGSDSSGLAYDALYEATDAGADILLMDTAGRLQNKQALMDELEKVIRVLRKIDVSAPHDVVLVLDATTGQNALNQVEVFRQRAGVTGVVMTKLDGTARGGILVAIAARFGLPVHAIGVGEGIDDLAPFDPDDFARTIAHM